MPIQFQPLTQANLGSATAFNGRIDRNHDAPFLLPGEIAIPQEHGVIRSQHYLAMDGAEARGGYLLVEYPALLQNQDITVANIQSPLSESIVDSKFAMLPLQMVKQFLSHNPRCFVVGMGDQGNPLPRLLRASGWGLESVPFYFRVHRVSRFLMSMPVLQSPWWKRLGARTVAYSGVGALGGKLVQRSKVALPPGASIQLESAWGDWAQEIWTEFAPALQFGVKRDLRTLQELYAPSTPRLRIHRISSGLRTVGWSSSILKPMENNPYFGNLLVASVLDCAAVPGFFGTVAALTDRALAEEGADLVITNQSLASWKDAFAAAGFRSGPSRFQLAVSPALTKALSKTPVSDGNIHVTRGDGDGRLNL